MARPPVTNGPKIEVTKVEIHPAVQANPPIDKDGDLKINVASPPEVQPLAPAGNQNTLTVTCENPTPPTNIVCAQGYPPQAANVVDPGRPYSAAIGLFAVNTLGTYLPEGSGTETSAQFPGNASTTLPGSGSSGGPNQTFGSDGTFNGGIVNKNHPSAPVTPTLTTIAPATSVHGGAPISMTLTGTGFKSNSAVYINGVQALPAGSGFQSSTSIVTGPLAIPAVAGAYTVTVVTPGQPTTAGQTWTIT